MKKLTALLAGSLVMLLGIQATYAQEGPTWSPLEIYGCNYVNGSDIGDLDRVIGTWTAWMDENGHDTYSAFVLTPHFTSASAPYDVGWLGTWTDGSVSQYAAVANAGW